MISGIESGNAVIVVTDQSEIDAVKHQVEGLGFSVSEKKTFAERLQQTLRKYTTEQEKHAGKQNRFQMGIAALLNVISSDVTTIILTPDNFSSIVILKNEIKPRKFIHRTIDEMERDHIVSALENCDWRCKTAARVLGIDRSTIYRKMKKYGIARMH